MIKLTRSFFQESHGFSLLEMSLVLAIMGTVTGLSLPLLIEHQEQKKIRTTQERLNHIKIATGIYVARYKHLPCPASTAKSGTPRTCQSSNMSSGMGYVPFKTLGLSEKMAVDGYGHPVRYAIDTNATKDSAYKSDNPPSTLHIESMDGVNLLDPNKARLALVLFSEGTAFSQPQSVAEQHNTALTLHFIDAPFSQRKEAPFRHIVSWSTYSHLIVIHGKGILPQENFSTGSPMMPSSTPSQESPVSAPASLPNNISAFDNNNPGF